MPVEENIGQQIPAICPTSFEYLFQLRIKVNGPGLIILRFTYLQANDPLLAIDLLPGWASALGYPPREPATLTLAVTP